MASHNFQDKPGYRTREQRIDEARWEDEGGPPLPDRAWARRMTYFERIYDSIFYIDYAELEKRLFASLFGGKRGPALMDEAHYHKGGFVRGNLNAYPFYVGGTRTGRWPGTNPPEMQEPRRVSRENHVTINITNTFEPGDATKVDAHIRKEAARLRAALEAPYRGDPQALDPYAAFAEYHRGDAAISQAMAKGTLIHKELEEQLRGPSWWKRFTAWLSKLYNPLWCI